MQCRVPSVGVAWLLLAMSSAAVVASASPGAAPVPPMPGAYQVAASIGPDDRAAATIAVRDRALQERTTLRLVAIERVDRQVVAGLNFRLRLRVELGGQPRMAEAVVYRNLQGQHQLMSWQWLLSRRAP
ncbi:MAG: hypothetical protein FGM43_10560 [Sinobacteraceae bacterium]|nr:hypothetical protein [Nevskiaceae bacterium]